MPRYPVMVEAKREVFSIRWRLEYLEHWGIWMMMRRFIVMIGADMEEKPSPLLGWINLIVVTIEPWHTGISDSYDIHLRAEVWVPFE